MILVTGGTGLLGAHLLYALALNNKNIRAIYRTNETLENVERIFSTYTKDYITLYKSITWIKADILDVPALDIALNGVNFVYHCAAYVSLESDKFKKLKRINVEGTANVVNLCISNNVTKLCHVSSIAAIGNSLNHTPITEKTIWNPEEDHSAYAISKYGAELEVWRGTQEGLDAVIINPGVILGSGFWNNGSGTIFKKIHKGLNYYPSGTISLIAVEDVVKIMILLLNSELKNERYILVAEHWNYKSFFAEIAHALHVNPPKKLAKSWLLNIVWRLDWIKHHFLRKPRLLSKHLAKALSANKTYNNTKITSHLKVAFTPIKKTIIAVSNLYLQQEQ